jgi:winged helix-turn-helix protein
MTTTSAPPLLALADRMLAAVVGSLEIAAAALGHRLGWYRCLADGVPVTAAELAARAGTDVRYTREWLEQQAVAGYLAVADAATPPEERRFSLPAEHAAVLVDELDPDYLVPLADATAAFVRQVPRLAEVYRGTRTLSWADLGDEVRDAQAAANRPFLVGPLVDEPGAGSPTSGAATAGPRSPSPAAGPTCGWTGSTSTSPRSSAAAGTRSMPGSPSGSPSARPTSGSWRPRRPTT